MHSPLMPLSLEALLYDFSSRFSVLPRDISRYVISPYLQYVRTIQVFDYQCSLVQVDLSQLIHLNYHQVLHGQIYSLYRKINSSVFYWPQKNTPLDVLHFTKVCLLTSPPKDLLRLDEIQLAVNNLRMPWHSQSVVIGTNGSLFGNRSTPPSELFPKVKEISKRAQKREKKLAYQGIAGRRK